VNIPSAYASRRNLANAYRRGFQAGTIADVGGVPLAPYEKLRSVQAYNDGFNAGQQKKAGNWPLDRVRKPIDDWQADAMKATARRVDDLLAFLEKLKGDIDAVLLGGVR
jgi:hypothetical protein